MTNLYAAFERRLRRLMVPTADWSPEEWAGYHCQRNGRRWLLAESALIRLFVVGAVIVWIAAELFSVRWLKSGLSVEAFLGLQSGQFTFLGMALGFWLNRRLWRFQGDELHAVLPIGDAQRWQAMLKPVWLVAAFVFALALFHYCCLVAVQDLNPGFLILAFVWAILQAVTIVVTCVLLVIGPAICASWVAGIGLISIPFVFGLSLAGLFDVPKANALAVINRYLPFANLLTPCGWVNQAFLAMRWEGDVNGWLWLVPIALVAFLQKHLVATTFARAETVFDPNRAPRLEQQPDQQPSSKRTKVPAPPPTDAELEALVRSSLLAPGVRFNRTDPIAWLIYRWLTPREMLLHEASRQTTPRWAGWFVLSCGCPFLLLGLMEVLPRNQSVGHIATMFLYVILVAGSNWLVALTASPMTMEGRTELSLPWIQRPSHKRPLRAWHFCYHLPVQTAEVFPLLFKPLIVQFILVSPLPLALAWWGSSLCGIQLTWVVDYTLRLSWISLNFACLALIINLPSGYRTDWPSFGLLVLSVLIDGFGLLIFMGVFAFWLVFMDAWWQQLVGFLGLPLCVLVDWFRWRRQLYAHNIDWRL